VIAPAHHAAPMLPDVRRVLRVQGETDDTFTLELDSGGRSAFAPGQFNMLYVFGVGEVAISLSGDPMSAGSLVHTIRAVGTVTSAMNQLRPGDALGVRGPFGRGWPVEEARGRDLLVIAGGLGMAPLRPLVYWVLRNPSAFRRLTLLYGSRTPEDLIFREEIEEWRWRGLPVHITVDRASQKWTEHVGLVTKLLPLAQFEPANTVAMICGPEIMMRVTAQALTQRGVSPERIFLSLERNMRCGVGLCGNCQYQSFFVCKDGPVHRFDTVQHLLDCQEI